MVRTKTGLTEHILAEEFGYASTPKLLLLLLLLLIIILLLLMKYFYRRIGQGHEFINAAEEGTDMGHKVV